MRRVIFFRTHSPRRIVKSTTYQLALAAVFTALTFAATIVVSIPIPATGGYVNVGDTMIFVAGCLFGPFVGGAAGGLGSMIADLVLGYAFYAPFTLLIKGLEGVLCGFLGFVLTKKIKRNVWKSALRFGSFAASGLLMCAGYFFLEFGYYDIGGALGGLPGNLIQAFSSVALASALVFFCKLGERVVKKSFPEKRNPEVAAFEAADDRKPEEDDRAENADPKALKTETDASEPPDGDTENRRESEPETQSDSGEPNFRDGDAPQSNGDTSEDRAR